MAHLAPILIIPIYNTRFIQAGFLEPNISTILWAWSLRGRGFCLKCLGWSRIRRKSSKQTT